MSKPVKFLGVEEPDFTQVGEALAKLVQKRILFAPGSRWNKTGHLMRSIDAVKTNTGIAIVTGNDRLQRDETARLFADEILPHDLDDATRKAIADAIFHAFKVDAK